MRFTIQDDITVDISPDDCAESGVIEDGVEKRMSWQSRGPGGCEPLDKSKCARVTITGTTAEWYFYLGRHA